MAPILSFTAEELWQVFTKEESVFLTTWHELPAPAGAAELMAKWTRLRALRDPVRKEIEALRAEGKVGSSLQAEVDFGAAARITTCSQAWATISSFCFSHPRPRPQNR